MGAGAVAKGSDYANFDPCLSYYRHPPVRSLPSFCTNCSRHCLPLSSSFTSFCWSCHSILILPPFSLFPSLFTYLFSLSPSLISPSLFLASFSLIIFLYFYCVVLIRCCFGLRAYFWILVLETPFNDSYSCTYACPSPSPSTSFTFYCTCFRLYFPRILRCHSHHTYPFYSLSPVFMTLMLFF